MSDSDPNIKTIFCDALACESPQDRVEFLARVCRDDAALRARVEELLQAHDEVGEFLGGGKPNATMDLPSGSLIAEALGTMIGPYKLLQQIGEGGMGTVYLAEQIQPVQRKVALKLIKVGMDSQQIIARFEAERQALALMDHPNIAKVLDAGTTAGGRPYFVMELVKGVPITRYCDEHHLTPKERLELFVPVCEAVQHAHQKSIIHRDLKPSNVMVCLYDGKPVPKVIDFGVAKATGSPLTERTLFTELGQVVGTLEYMSPEQAELNQLDVDTRSDIYSLGVLLYELLTGTTPLEKKRFKEAAFMELLRLIREEDPPKPSTRLSTTEGLPSIAANRGLEPKKLSGLMRGELDWIAMKCLEKDRNRRYATANGLARDVERYLRDEAVQACPPSALYRFRKFARRNKRALLTASLLSGTMAVAVVLLFVSYLRLQVEQSQTAREYARAEAQKVVADQHRAEAEDQKIVADEQRAEAEDRLKLVFEALDEVFVKEVETQAALQHQAIERQGSSDPQREQAEREFLEKGLRLYQKLSQRPSTSPAAQAEIGRSLRRVGVLQQCLRRFKEAEHALRESSRLFETLAKRFPEVAEYTLERADTLQWLYWPLSNSGRDQEATQVTHQVLNLLEKLPDKFRNDESARRWMARCHSRLGNVQTRTDPQTDIVRELQLAEDLYRQLSIDFPLKTQYRDCLAETAVKLGNYLADSGQRQEAAAAFGEVAAVYEKLISETADHVDAATAGIRGIAGENAWYRHELGNVCILRGDLLRKLGQLPEADAVLTRGSEVHQKLVAEFPTKGRYKSRLAWNHVALGDLRKVCGQRREAEQAYRQAVAIMAKAGLTDRFFAGAYERLGQLCQEDGRIADALEARRQAVAAWVKLTAKGNNRDFRWHLACAYEELAKTSKQANNIPAAEVAFRKALVVWEGLVREMPDYGDYRFHLHCTYQEVIDLPLPPGQAASDWKAAIDALNDSILLRSGGDANDWFFLAIVRWQLGEKEDARKWYDQAVAWMEKNDPKNEELSRFREEAEALLK